MIRRQVVLPTDPERVWAALTDPEQAGAWIGGRIEWEVREGAELRFDDDGGPRRDGRVETVRPGRYLRYRWWDEDGGEASEVSYLLEPHEGGTRLTIQERPVEPGSAGATACASNRGSSGATVTPFTWSRWDERMAGAWVTLAGRGDRARA